MTSILEDKRQ